MSPSAPFSPNVRITDDTTPFPQHVEPSLVVDPRGHLYVGWKEAFTPDGPGQAVAFSRSEDGGLTWSANILPDPLDPNWHQSDPWLTLDETGRLHFARLNYSADLTEGRLSVSSSVDGGRTWSATVNPDDRTGFADKESLASDGNGSLYVAYDDVTSGSADQGDRVDLRISRSTDRGLTWSPTAPVADDAGLLLGPVVAAHANGTVIAAWWNLTNGNVLADTSQDHGSTWGPDVRVNPVPGSAEYVNTSWAGSMPSITLDGPGRVYVAWADRGADDLDVLVARSEDAGLTWSTPVRVNDDASRRDQWMPSMVADAGGILHAAWLDGRTGNWNVYYAKSTDAGRTWSPNLRVTTAETAGSFARPGDYLALAADANGTAYVAWTDGRDGSLDIYFARHPSGLLPLQILANPSGGTIPFTVSFSATLDGGVPPYVYDWDFGDGSRSTSPAPSHTFGAAGDWPVRLTVTDANGLTGTSTIVVQAREPFPWVPVVALSSGIVLAAIAYLFLRRRRGPPVG
jgi:hypothetical protein